MAKTIATCAVVKKQSYYYGKPKVVDGKCQGYVRSKRPYGLLSTCAKCRFCMYDGQDICNEQ